MIEGHTALDERIATPLVDEGPRASVLRHATSSTPSVTLTDRETWEVLPEVREVAEQARDAAAKTHPFSPERAYWRGVEVAAEQVLRPDAVAVDQVSWLDRANPAFISGFVQTTAMLAPVWTRSRSFARRREERRHLHSA